MDGEMNAEQVIAEYWRRTQARDWEGVHALLAPELEVEWMATGELFAGRDAFVGMNRAYPEGWEIQVRQIVANGPLVVSETLVPYVDGTLFAVTSWWEVEGGLIQHGREYYVTVGAETPPAWRAAYSTARDSTGRATPPASPGRDSTARDATPAEALRAQEPS
jgi:hypothetical protein